MGRLRLAARRHSSCFATSPWAHHAATTLAFPHRQPQSDHPRLRGAGRVPVPGRRGAGSGADLGAGLAAAGLCHLAGPVAVAPAPRTARCAGAGPGHPQRGRDRRCAGRLGLDGQQHPAGRARRRAHGHAGRHRDHQDVQAGPQIGRRRPVRIAVVHDHRQSGRRQEQRHPAFGPAIPFRRRQDRARRGRHAQLRLVFHHGWHRARHGGTLLRRRRAPRGVVRFSRPAEKIPAQGTHQRHPHRCQHRRIER